ncbi:MAG: endonuclease/exonuclease/phosphatase family protein, partial [Pseudonocardiaceae bacterium]
DRVKAANEPNSTALYTEVAFARVSGDGGGEHRRVVVGRLITLLLAAGVAVAVSAALLRIFGGGGSRWTFAALVFTPYALGGAGLLVVLGLATRRWVISAGAVLAAVVLGVGVLPRAVADAQPDATGPVLTVGSANLYFGRVDAHAVVDLVRPRDVDVLSLQELTPQAITALDTAGLGELLPYRVFRPEPRAAGTGLASRYPLRERASTRPSYHWQPAALVDLPGGLDVEVVAVHTVAPVGMVQPFQWRAEITDLPQPLAGRITRVLAGDFNATLDHRPLRALLGTGYRDAADAMGRGLRATWPTDMSIAPIAAIDHVLVAQICLVRSFDTIPLPNGDHRAVVAEIELPG